MSSVIEIKALEEQLRLAELAPDADFFDNVLSDDVLLDGQKLKSKVVEAHRPGKGQKFANVEMSDFNFVDHGDVVVVTCLGKYQTAEKKFQMKFMRVWMKKVGRWQVVAAATLEGPTPIS